MIDCTELHTRILQPGDQVVILRDGVGFVGVFVFVHKVNLLIFDLDEMCIRDRPEPLTGDVRFHDVSFGYTPERIILQNLSLYAKPGQKIAFVGSTGAGKTTITNLLNRFYEAVSYTHLYNT